MKKEDKSVYEDSCPAHMVVTKLDSFPHARFFGVHRCKPLTKQEISVTALWVFSGAVQALVSQRYFHRSSSFPPLTLPASMKLLMYMRITHCILLLVEYKIIVLTACPRKTCLPLSVSILMFRMHIVKKNMLNQT